MLIGFIVGVLSMGGLIIIVGGVVFFSGMFD